MRKGRDGRTRRGGESERGKTRAVSMTENVSDILIQRFILIPSKGRSSHVWTVMERINKETVLKSIIKYSFIGGPFSRNIV